MSEKNPSLTEIRQAIGAILLQGIQIVPDSHDWICPRCERLDEDVRYKELADNGSPRCPSCEIEMVLED